MSDGKPRSVHEKAPEGLEKTPEGNYLFAEGNQLWKHAIHTAHKKRKFQNPEELLEACCGYFQWLDNNPLQEARLSSYQGDNEIVDIPKLRAPTLQGLCLYLGINRTTWGAMRRKQTAIDFTEVISWAEDYMFNNKFEGAASGLLNPMIIARDLGLAERNELTGKDGQAITTTQIDWTKLDTATLEKLLAARVSANGDDDAPTE